MNNFGIYMSIHLRATMLYPAIQQLSSANKRLHKNITNTGLIDIPQPSNIPEHIEMLHSVLRATGVFEQKKLVCPSWSKLRQTWRWLSWITSRVSQERIRIRIGRPCRLRCCCRFWEVAIEVSVETNFFWIRKSMAYKTQLITLCAAIPEFNS